MESLKGCDATLSAAMFSHIIEARNGLEGGPYQAALSALLLPEVVWEDVYM